jgi:hypothetical protein
MTTARERLVRYRTDPVAFCREILRFEPWSKQRQILESVRDHNRTAVRSCHAAGKTAIAARAVVWFLAVHPHAKVITTAPTLHQVRDLLWREIHLAYQAAGGFIGGELYDTRLELATDWFAVGLSTDQPERFQGHHAEHLLVVFDEASGIDEEIYEAASGFMTSPGARSLLIGNPTRTSGEFFNAFHNARGFYNPIAIAASSTPAFTGEPVPEQVLRQLVSPQWVDEHTRKWGEGSPLWQIRINAEFPSQSDDAVISLRDLEDAQARTLEPGLPLILACDVARFGSDQTVIALRRGNVIRIVKSYGGRDTMHTVGELTRLARQLEETEGRRPVIVIDDAGLGGAVTDRLQELNEYRIHPYHGGRSASHPRDYPNRRSEDWFTLGDVLPHIDLDSDQELAADLLAPRYTIDSQGRRVVEPKADTKKRLRRSPDRADAVIMAISLDPPGRPPRGQRRTSVPRGRIDTIPHQHLSYAERHYLERTQGDSSYSTIDAELSQRLGLPAPGIHFRT